MAGLSLRQEWLLHIATQIPCAVGLAARKAPLGTAQTEITGLLVWPVAALQQGALHCKPSQRIVTLP